MRKYPDPSRLLIAMCATLSMVAGAAASGASPASAQTEAPPTSSASTTSPQTNTVGAASTNGTASAAGANSIAAPAAVSIHVPLIAKSWPLNTIFGTETANVPGNAAAVVGAGATWLRKSGLDWYKVEPTEGARNWSAIAAIEADMVLAAKNNIQIVPIIFGAPPWAQQSPGATCGRIRADKIDAFAAFVRDAVARYSKPPYNVRYWEIWNEPDLPQGAVSSFQYGCWGDPSDTYYGGGYYASVLKQVSPQIRAVDPGAKILLGGLLLDCPGSASCRAGNYLEGIILGGGAPHFDGVNFHAYDAYNASANALGNYSWSAAWGTAWNTTGPTTTAKSRFVKSVLNKHGVGGKFLLNTEVALVCWECTTAPSNFEATKAYYIPQAYGAAIAEGLVANMWYSWEGWFLSGLYGVSLDAYKTAAAKLGSVGYIGEITTNDVGTAGVRGYKFTSNGKPMWLIWSADGGTKTVTLPGTPTAITDAVGAAQAAAKTVSLTVKPLYVELP